MVSLEWVLQDLTQDLSDSSIGAVVYGRDEEVLKLSIAVARQSNDPILLIGDPNVGRTMIVRALASSIVRDEIDGLSGHHVFVLDLNRILDNGSNAKATMQSIIRSLQLNLPNILYVPQANLITNPPIEKGSISEAIDMLRSFITERSTKFIGALTPKVYQLFSENDSEAASQYTPIKVEPMTEEKALEVLLEVKPALEHEHSTGISNNALKAAIALGQKHMPEEFLPTKAFKIIAKACERLHLKKEAKFQRVNAFTIESMRLLSEKLSKRDVRRAVSLLTSVSTTDLDGEEANDWMEGFLKKLELGIAGQSLSIRHVAEYMKEIRLRGPIPDKPIGTIMFTGPPGVGKTLLCTALHRTLLGQKTPLWQIDMSQFADENAHKRLIMPSSQESNQLLEAAKANIPIKMVVLDHFDRAHKNVVETIRSILSTNNIQDTTGYSYEFTNCLFVLTATIKAKVYSSGSVRMAEATVTEIIEKHFGKPFFDMVNEIVMLRPLRSEEGQILIRSAIQRLLPTLSCKDIGIRLAPNAFTYLVRKCCDNEFGAHNIAPSLHKLVIAPISEGITNGTFGPGDVVEVQWGNEGLIFIKSKPRTKAPVS